jgi:ABC-type thiamine transport system ATPase subunit
MTLSTCCQASSGSGKCFSRLKIRQEVGLNHGLRLQKELKRKVVWMSKKVGVTQYSA